ncbi:MAG: hypothetical protein EOP06_30940 [Proteobacteria bacterium]|nr:MAG: hypothetical protein EOP06_30940 [Pseudomonadota bacterium]
MSLNESDTWAQISRAERKKYQPGFHKRRLDADVSALTWMDEFGAAEMSALGDETERGNVFRFEQEGDIDHRAYKWGSVFRSERNRIAATASLANQDFVPSEFPEGQSHSRTPPQALALCNQIVFT